MDSINLPPEVRRVVYIVATVASPVMFYLNTEAVVSDFWFGLFSVVMSAVTALAAVNVNVKGKK